MNRRYLFAVCFVAAIPGFSRWGLRPTAYVAAGPSLPANPFANRVDHGRDVSAGAGMTINRLDLMFDFTFNDFD